MRAASRLTLATAASLLTLLACSGGPVAPSSPDGLHAIVAAPSIALGADIPVVLRNRSPGSVTVGPLGCSADLERWNRFTGGWDRLASFRRCMAIFTHVALGTDLAFDVPSPDAAGRYRILFEARPANRDPVEVRSNEFEVQQDLRQPGPVDER